MTFEPLFLKLLQFLDIKGLFQTQIFTDSLHLFDGYFFWWNSDHGLKCGHYVPTISILM